MIQFSQLLSPKNIRQGVICSSKKRIFELISTIAAPYINCLPTDQDNAEHYCFESLLIREKVGNSSLGNGLAVPKGRLIEGQAPVVVFLQLASGVDYEAHDNREVDLVFALLIPADRCHYFSSQLPILMNFLQDKTILKQLRMAQTTDEIWQIFVNLDNLMAQTQLEDQASETSQTSENEC